MSDFLADATVFALAVLAAAFSVAWWTLFPTLGVLWLLGWLA
jgi:hypothetical protein